jgi:tau tubulin kinase
MFNVSQIIKGRWKIIKKIGQGAFGETYQAKNIITGENVAIKIEKIDTKKQVLKLEVAVLKKLQECPHICRFISCGKIGDEYNYLVMELLGENLSELRRRQENGKFSMLTTLKLGMQMLRAIESVHLLGYLHRDIKPSNFVVGYGLNKRNNIFLIDFGLARRYLLPNSNEVRPSRDTTGFRGTARYASINSHLSRDLGRRDDLWSLFYVLVEFVKGTLPWRKLKEKEQIGEMKIQYNNIHFVSDLPPEFSSFMEHLQTLQYQDKPDYDYLHSLLYNLYCKLGGNENTAFDWEVKTQKIQINKIDSSLKPSINDKEENKIMKIIKSNSNDNQPLSNDINFDELKDSSKENKNNNFQSSKNNIPDFIKLYNNKENNNQDNYKSNNSENIPNISCEEKEPSFHSLSPNNSRQNMQLEFKQEEDLPENFSKMNIQENNELKIILKDSENNFSPPQQNIQQQNIQKQNIQQNIPQPNINSLNKKSNKNSKKNNKLKKTNICCSKKCTII